MMTFEIPVPLMMVPFLAGVVGILSYRYQLTALASQTAFAWAGYREA
jgi:hypothetical protein